MYYVPITTAKHSVSVQLYFLYLHYIQSLQFNNCILIPGVWYVLNTISYDKGIIILATISMISLRTLYRYNENARLILTYFYTRPWTYIYGAYFVIFFKLGIIWILCKTINLCLGKNSIVQYVIKFKKNLWNIIFLYSQKC